jgi:hypothetical protein
MRERNWNDPEARLPAPHSSALKRERFGWWRMALGASSNFAKWPAFTLITSNG